jgi:hypothetical protein
VNHSEATLTARTLLLIDRELFVAYGASNPALGAVSDAVAANSCMVPMDRRDDYHLRISVGGDLNSHSREAQEGRVHILNERVPIVTIGLRECDDDVVKNAKKFVVLDFRGIRNFKLVPFHIGHTWPPSPLNLSGAYHKITGIRQRSRGLGPELCPPDLLNRPSAPHLFRSSLLHVRSNSESPKKEENMTEWIGPSIEVFSKINTHFGDRRPKCGDKNWLMQSDEGRIWFGFGKRKIK